MASVVGQASAATTSVAIPAHQPGDMILVFARGTVAPTIPTAGGTVPAWGTLQSSAQFSIALTCVFFVATGSTTTTGTFTNATHIAVLVIRPAANRQLTTAAARSAVGGANNATTIIYPALTLAKTDGTSMGVRIGTRVTAATQLATAPTNWTNQTQQPATTPALVVHTRAALAANPVADTVTAGAANAAYRAVTVEVQESVPPTYFGSTTLALTAGRVFAGQVPVPPPNETVIDDFNRANGLLDAGAGAAIWNLLNYQTGAATDLRVIGNALGETVSGQQSAYTKAQFQTDFDCLFDLQALAGAPMFFYYLLANPGTSNWTAYRLTLVPGVPPTWQLDWFTTAGTQSVNLGSNSTVSPAAGDSIWFRKRGAQMQILRRPSGGSFAEIFASVIPSGGVIENTVQTNDTGFGATNNTRVAQPFVAGSSMLKEVRAWLKTSGSPTDSAVVELWTGGSSPSATLGVIAVIPAVSLTTTEAQFTWPCSIPLAQGQTYWVVFRRSGALSDTDYFRVRGTATNPGGWTVAQNYNSTTSGWSAAGLPYLTVRTETAPYAAPGAFAAELTETTTRLDNLRGGPLFVAAPTTYYGVVAAPSSFAAVTQAQRQTFGTVAVPLAASITTAGDISAGLVPVGASVAVPFAVRAAVGASRTAPYVVASAVGVSRSAPYVVRTALGASRSAPYAVAIAVGTSRASPFLVAQLAATSRTTPYVVRSIVGGSRASPYVLIAYVGASRTSPFIVRGAVGTSRSLPYALIAALGTSRGTPYAVTTLVGAGRTAPYGVGTLIGASRVAPYVARTALGTSRSSPYGVTSLLGASRSAPYGVATSVGAARSTPYTLSVLASANRSTPYALVALASANRTTPYTLSALAGASRTTPYALIARLGGSRSTPYTVAVIGAQTYFGVVAVPATFAATTAARRKTFGGFSAPFSAGLVMQGQARRFASFSVPLAFSAATQARRKTFGGFAAPFTVSAATQARRKTFGQVAVPLTSTIVTAGVSTTGARTYFGSFSAPATFAATTQARRKTFGQVAVPLALGAVTQGRRKTFGQLVMPLTGTVVTAGIRRAGPQTYYGAFAAGFGFRAVTDGRIKTAAEARVQVSFAQLEVPPSVPQPVGVRLVTPFGVRVAAGRSLATPYGLTGALGVSVTTLYVVTGIEVRLALVTPYAVQFTLAGLLTTPYRVHVVWTGDFIVVPVSNASYVQPPEGSVVEVLEPGTLIFTDADFAELLLPVTNVSYPEVEEVAVSALSNAATVAVLETSQVMAGAALETSPVIGVSRRLAYAVRALSAMPTVLPYVVRSALAVPSVVPFAVRSPVGGSFAAPFKVADARDPDVLAYLAATGLDSGYAPALDTLVVGLKQHGLWSKMLAVYPMIGGTAALHKWNLRDPKDSDASYRLTFNGGGTHSTALGYRANQQGDVYAGGYADTHLVPNGRLDVNSTHLGFYSLAEVPVSDRCEMGCYNWAGAGSRFHVIARYNGGLFYYGMSEEGASNCAVPSSTGLFVATRTASDSQSAYRNGVLVSTPNPAPPTNGLPPVSVWIGGIDSYRGFSDLPCGFASIGSGLNAQNVADLYAVVQAFQAVLGRQT
jgi:hypothetical protein